MEGNLITCSTCDDLHVKRCEISQRCGIWKGHHHIWFVVQIQWLLPKMEQMKPHQNMTYYTLSGPVFLCRFRIWSQNSNILFVASDMACFLCINGVNDQFNHSRCSNCYNCYHGSQDIVPYVWNVGQNSLHQPSRYNWVVVVPANMKLKVASWLIQSGSIWCAICFQWSIGAFDRRSECSKSGSQRLQRNLETYPSQWVPKWYTIIGLNLTIILKYARQVTLSSTVSEWYEIK